MSTLRSKPQVTLFALLVIATALRLVNLNSGMWLDEFLTYSNYAKLPFSEILRTFDSENQHLLYSLLAHASFLVFGESAWALRLPAALFGVGSIAALYLLGNEVTTRREAFFASTLLTFSYHHIWFSQNGRGYTSLLFWTTVSSWLLLRGIREPRLKTWVSYALTAAFGLYTHLTMAFVVLTHLLIYLIAVIAALKENRRIPLAGLSQGFGLAGLLTIILYSPIIPQILGTVSGTKHSVANAWKVPYYTLVKIINFLKNLEMSSLLIVVIAMAILIFGIGLFSYVRSKPVVLGLLLFPSLIGTAIVIGTNHYLWPRFFFFLAGFGALVTIRGVMEFGRILGRLLRLPMKNSFQVGTALCGVLILMSALTVPFVYGPKQDYASALTFIEATQRPGDVVIAIGPTGIPYRDYYKKDWKIVTTTAGLSAIRSQSERIWTLYTLPSVLKAEFPDLMDIVLNNCNVVEQFPGTLGDGTISVCILDG